MKTVIAWIVLVALCSMAQAKVAPQEDARIVIATGEATIPSGAAGAIPEADYFRAPLPLSDRNRIFPCRPQLRLFDKTRLAQFCH